MLCFGGDNKNGATLKLALPVLEIRDINTRYKCLLQALRA